MGSVETYKGRTYEEDYNEICRLEAAVDVLERKNKDYERISKGAENDFNAACRELAEYQLIQDELTHFTWRKLKAKLLFRYDKEYEENSRSIDATKRKIEGSKYRMQDGLGKLKDVADTLKKAKNDYEAQRSYMKNVYTEFNGYEQRLNNERVRLQGIIKEIDEAVTAVDEVLEIAKCALQKYKSAQNLGIADMLFDSSFFLDIAKYNRINDAESMTYVLNAAVARMNKEVRDVGAATQVYCQEFDTGMKMVDIMFDNALVDALALSKIHNNISALNQFIVNIQNMRSDLMKNRSAAVKEMNS